MIPVIYFFVLLLSSFVIHIAFRSSKPARLIDKIPGPTPLSFIGNGLMLTVPTMWNLFLQLIHDYYPIAQVWIFHISVVFIGHPDSIKDILSCKTNIDKWRKLVYNGYRTIDNDGLVVSGGEKWHRRRKLLSPLLYYHILSPAFTTSMLKAYTEMINEHIERLIKDIKQKHLQTELDLIPTYEKIALRIICEAVTGVDVSSFGAKKEEQFRHDFNDICDVIYYRAMRPYIQNWMMKFLKVGRKQERAIASFRQFTEMIIKQRREYHESYSKLQNTTDKIHNSITPTNKRKRSSVIDLLLNAEAEGLIDAKGINEEVETFIAAGYDTSGVAITFALMLLAENRNVQDLARAEVTQILKQTGSVLKMADMNNLDYLDRCIKGTLRLYPSGPLIGNYEIPTGTDVVMHLYYLHRDPRYWSDPEKFNPDRFLSKNMREHHSATYLPFGTGPRTCIGNKFAILEIKVAVARILYNFYIEPVDLLADVKFKVHATLMPKDPCRVKLISINRKSTG